LLQKLLFMRKLKVLLVEDDKMLCAIFEMFLVQMGHDLIGIYHDAESALEKCNETTPDLAVLDIHISGDLDGIQAANILQNKYDLPILFLSGDTEEETLMQANNIKCKVFLSKPIYKSTLRIAIEIALLRNCNSKFDAANPNSDIDKLMSKLEEPILVLRDFEIIKANDIAARFFQLNSVDELITKSIIDFLSPESISKFNETFDSLLNLKLLLEYIKLNFEHNDFQKLNIGVSISFIQNINENISILYFDYKP